MTRKSYPPDVVEQAKAALANWQKMGPPAPQFGEFTASVFYNQVQKANGFQTQIKDLENQLDSLRNQRDDANELLAEQLKRLRAGIKAVYGDDANEYEMVGGTRASERKSALTRKKATAP